MSDQAPKPKRAKTTLHGQVEAREGCSFRLECQVQTTFHGQVKYVEDKCYFTLREALIAKASYNRQRRNIESGCVCLYVIEFPNVAA